MSAEEKEKVFAVLNAAGIGYKAENHPAVFTVEDMINLQISHIDKIAKNLFLRDDKKRDYYILVMKSDKSANLKQLRRLIGSRPLTFADENDLNEYLGLSKGAVSPLGVLNDIGNTVTVIIDNELKSFDFIGIHPNDNTATIFISIDDLIKVIGNDGRRIIFAEI